MLKCHENAGFAVQHLCLTFQMQGASAASCVLGMAITGDKHYLLGTSALTTSARFVPPWDSSELGRKYPCGINYLQIALR